MQNIDLSKLPLTEKWALLAKLREQRDVQDTNIRILRESISTDEAELAKKQAEDKIEVPVESVPMEDPVINPNNA